MVTYFNRKDLVNFGSYLLSEKRKARFQSSFDQDVQDGLKSPISVEERLKNVWHADVENWIHEMAASKDDYLANRMPADNS